MGGVLLGVWDTADSGSFVQLSGVNIVVLRQQLGGGGKELLEGAGKWGWLANILGREGVDRITVGRFYVAMVQAVLLFGSEK